MMVPPLRPPKHFRSSVLARIVVSLLTVVTLPSSLAHYQIGQGVILTVLPTNHPQYQQVETAVEIAVREINKNLSASHQLTVRHETEKGAVKQLSRTLVYLQEENIVAIMGLPSGPLVTLFGAVAGALHVPAISFGVMYRGEWTPAYYPSLFYAAPANHDLPWLLKELLLRFVCRKVCLIQSKAFSAYGQLQEFARVVAPAYNIKVHVTVSVDYNEDDDEISLRLLTELHKMRQECAMFVVGVNENDLLPVMRAANIAGLLSKGKAWIFLNMLTGPRLLPEELQGYMDGSLIVRPYVSPDYHYGVAQKITGSLNLPANVEFENITMEAIFAHEATLHFGRAYKNWTESSSSRLHTLPKVVLHKDVFVPPLSNGDDLIDALTATPLGKHREQSTNDYDIFNFKDRTLIPVGNWTESSLSNIQSIEWTGNTMKIPTCKAVDADPILNTSLKILVGLSPPFTYMNDTVPGESRIGGVAIDLLENISAMAGFNYTLDVWSDDWTEMVRLVGREESVYEMAVGSITVTAARSQLCRFTRSFFLSGLYMMTPRPKMAGGLFDFLDPFSFSVWLCLIGTIVFSAVVIYILDPKGIRTDRSGHWFFDAIFFSSNVFLFVHDSDLISTRWAMVFLIMFQFPMHILQSSYTANMASFLSSRTVESKINSYFDLAQHHVAVRRGTSNLPYVRDDLALRKLVLVKDGEEALEKLRSGEAEAYIADIPHVEKIVATQCDMIIPARPVQPQTYAFAMKQNSPWADEINRMMSIALANGVVTRSYERHLQHKCPPQETDNNENRALSLNNLGGIYAFALIAAVFLIPLKIYRLVTTTRKRPKFPLRSLATQQVCYPSPSPSPLPGGRSNFSSVSSRAGSTDCIVENTQVVQSAYGNTLRVI